jgi:hypothetical protein
MAADAALTLASKGNVALCCDLDGNKFSNVNLIYIVSIMIPSYHDAFIYRRLLLFNIKSYYIISSLLWHVWDETVCWIKFVNIWIFWYTHISAIQKFSTIMMWSYIVSNSQSQLKFDVFVIILLILTLQVEVERIDIGEPENPGRLRAKLNICRDKDCGHTYATVWEWVGLTVSLDV